MSPLFALILGLAMLAILPFFYPAQAARLSAALRQAANSRGIAVTPQSVVGAVLFLGVALMLGMLIGIIGLGEFKSNMRFERIPAYYWAYWNYADVRSWFWKGFGSAVLGGGLLVLVASRERVKLHGDARWANQADVRKAQLLADKGIILGRAFGKTLRLGGTEHVLVEAPTRAGKGVGIVIPNLLEWEQSAVILDVKQENFQVTGGYRASTLGQQVFLVNPLDVDGKTACYNPLDYIKRSDAINVIHELQKVGMMLYPEPQGESFWMDSARTAFIGLGAYVAARADKPFSIGQIYREVTGAKNQKAVQDIIAEMAKAGTPLSREAQSALSSYANNSDNTYAGIRSTVLSKINLWVNPHVDAATSRSDFSLEQLRKGIRIERGGVMRTVPISLYLGVSPNDIETVQPFYNLLVQQIVDLNVRELFDDRTMFKVLVMLDEFARLGQSTMLAQSFSYVAGYGLRLVPVVQSRSQLRAIYGPDVAKEIITNCGAEVIFGVKEKDITEELEHRIGYYTFAAQSRSHKTWEHWSGSRSVSDQRRPLLMAQEIRDLDASKALIFRAAMPALMARKIRYFEEAAFTARSKVQPPNLFPTRALPAAAGSDGVAMPARRARALEAFQEVMKESKGKSRKDHQAALRKAAADVIALCEMAFADASEAVERAQGVRQHGWDIPTLQELEAFGERADLAESAAPTDRSAAPAQAGGRDKEPVPVDGDGGEQPTPVESGKAITSAPDEGEDFAS